MEKIQISVLIAAKNEHKNIRASVEHINRAVSYTKRDYEIIIVCADSKTYNLANSLSSRKLPLTVVKEDKSGKPEALNQAIRKSKGEYLLFTDADVLVKNENTIKELLQGYKNKRVGFVSARPVPINKRTHKLGYWAKFLALLAHFERKEHSRSKTFYPPSGNLFSTKRSITPKLPKNILVDDHYIGAYIFNRGFLGKYCPRSRVFYKSPTTLNDFIKQKLRTLAGTKQIKKYFPLNKGERSMSRESLVGVKKFFVIPKNPKEYFWTLQLYIVRLLLWIIAYIYLIFNKKKPLKLWTEIKTTKNLRSE